MPAQKRKRGAGFRDTFYNVTHPDEYVSKKAANYVAPKIVNAIMGPPPAEKKTFKQALAGTAGQAVKWLAPKIGAKIVNAASNAAGDYVSKLGDDTKGGTIHCLKCKTHTRNGKMTMHTTQKGGQMVKTTCHQCGAKKCRFVKKGSGFFDDAWSGIKKGVETAAPYVQAAQPYLSTAATLAPLVL